MSIRELNNNKAVLIGSNYSGKSELGVELAYSNLKIGNKVKYVTTKENINSIKDKFLAKDFIKGLNVVNENSLSVIDKDILCENCFDNHYNIYIFDGVSTEDFAEIIENIRSFEEISKLGILFITNKGIDVEKENTVLSGDVQDLFKQCYSIVSSTIIDKKELLGKEVDTYIMRLNILDMSRLSAVDEEIFIDILSR